MGVSITALFLGLTLWYPLNWFWKLEDESSRYIDEEGDPFEQLINKALDSATPVMLTLKGGKVYVGFVVSSFAPAREQRTIHIAPIKSGYREGAKLRVVFTTDYSEALEKMTSDLSKLLDERDEAANQLEQLEKTYKSQEQKRESLTEGGEKKKKGLKKLQDAMAVSESQQQHLERVLETQTQAIENLAASIEKFGIVLPIAEITSVTLYSAQVHAEYFPHKDPE
jgi:septal ring factor EnvC (AmiA/AmiB activator)